MLNVDRTSTFAYMYSW